jgi:hypothetical protein
LLIVNVRLVVPFSGIVEAPNALLMVGGATTVKLAKAVVPLPPSVELTALVVLFCTPAATPATLTEKVHELFAAIVPPVRVIEVLLFFAVIVPDPQEPVRSLGAATWSPVGRLSVNATPPRLCAAFGLVIVKLKLVVPFSGIVAAPNTLLIVGGVTTVTLAEAVPPVPPSVELIAVVVLFFTPTVVPVTFTEKVHVPFTASVAPDRVIELPPAVAVIVPPPHVPVCPFGVDTTRPAGNESENAMLLRLCVVFGLVMVKLRLVLPFSGIVGAPNVLLIVGGATTVMLALLVLPVPPFVEVTLTELFFTPPVVPVTFTEKVQELFAASVAADSEIELEPDVAVIDPPPHVPVTPFGVATTSPAGIVSMNATPVSDTVFAAGFVIVKVRFVVPFSGIVAAPNALLIVGGAITVWVIAGDDVLVVKLVSPAYTAVIECEPAVSVVVLRVA